MAKKTLIPTDEPKTTAVVPVESNPGGWLAPAPEPNVIAPPNTRTAYVTFASGKAKSFPRMVQAIPDLAEGDPVLVLPEPMLPVKLSPFRFFFPGYAFQHWTASDEDGAIIATSLADPGRDAAIVDPKTGKDTYYGEHIEACLLVIHGAKLVPARATFKTTKTNGIHAALDALKVAKKPEWADISPAHKATLMAPAPWLRFTVTVTVGPYLSKSTGRTSRVAKGKANPATAADWQMVREFFEGEGNAALTETVQQAWSRRVEEIKRGV
jgi:hypothetical protein